MRSLEGRVHHKTQRERFAELTSSLGAGILGVGLGVLLARYLKTTWIPLVILGGGMHAFGMWDMRRMERVGGLSPRPLWSLLLYWVCWIALAGMAMFVLMWNA
jgi:hypothetical protein